MNEGDKAKSNQGADQTQHGDKRQEFDIGCRFGVWINHFRAS